MATKGKHIKDSSVPRKPTVSFVYMPRKPTKSFDYIIKHGQISLLSHNGPASVPLFPSFPILSRKYQSSTTRRCCLFLEVGRTLYTQSYSSNAHLQ